MYMLFDADLPKRFWADAVSMAVNGIIPYEVFHGKSVALSDLRIFSAKVSGHERSGIRNHKS